MWPFKKNDFKELIMFFPRYRCGGLSALRYSQYFL